MNTRTEHLLMVTQYIAKSFDLDYAQNSRELLSSTKPIEIVRNIQPVKSLGGSMTFYRNYNWLYLIVIPVAAIISFLATSLLTFHNGFGIFLTVSIAGIIFVYFINDYEKRKNQLLILTKDSLNLYDKVYAWTDIEDIYIYERTSYARRIPRYYLIILDKSQKIFMRELHMISNMSKVRQYINAYRNLTMAQS